MLAHRGLALHALGMLVYGHLIGGVHLPIDLTPMDDDDWIDLTNIQDWDTINDPLEIRRRQRSEYWKQKYIENKNDPQAEKQYVRTACRNGHTYEEGSFVLNVVGTRLCVICRDAAKARRAAKR